MADEALAIFAKQVMVVDLEDRAACLRAYRMIGDKWGKTFPEIYQMPSNAMSDTSKVPEALPIPCDDPLGVAYSYEALFALARSIGIENKRSASIVWNCVADAGLIVDHSTGHLGGWHAASIKHSSTSHLLYVWALVSLGARGYRNRYSDMYSTSRTIAEAVMRGAGYEKMPRLEMDINDPIKVGYRDEVNAWRAKFGAAPVSFVY